MSSDQQMTHVPEIPGENQRRLNQALWLLVGILALGTGGLMWLENWDFWRALFFTLITVTTVGYGDEGISEIGQRFTILLMVGGIGMASYTFALVVQAMVTNQIAWRRRMQSRIDKLDGHVIVCGFGRMGRTLCEELSSADEDFLVIEIDSVIATEALEMGYAVIQGSATEDEILLQAGIERANHFVCAMNCESENIVATLSARQIRSDISIIARAERMEEIRKLKLAGATRTVAPFHLGGVEIATAITRPKVADFLAASTRAESAVVLAELEIEQGSPLCGRTISNCGRSVASHVSFVTLERHGEEARTPPGGSTEFKVGDLLILAGNPDQIRWMRDAAVTPGKLANNDEPETIHSGVPGVSVDSVSSPLRSGAAQEVADAPIAPEQH